MELIKQNRDFNFKTIYTQYFQKSFLFVKSYVFDNMIAEDIVSECIIRVWQDSQKEVIVNMNAYLYRVLKNSTLNYLKHERMKYKSFDKLRENHFEELTLRINTLETCFLEDILAKEILEIVKLTLNETSSISKEIFVLSRFKGKSNKEIAAKMNITVKNVEYHITKVLRLLRLNLQDYLIGIGIFLCLL